MLAPLRRHPAVDAGRYSQVLKVNPRSVSVFQQKVAHDVVKNINDVGIVAMQLVELVEPVAVNKAMIWLSRGATRSLVRHECHQNGNQVRKELSMPSVKLALLFDGYATKAGDYLFVDLVADILEPVKVFVNLDNAKGWQEKEQCDLEAGDLSEHTGLQLWHHVKLRHFEELEEVLMSPAVTQDVLEIKRVVYFL